MFDHFLLKNRTPPLILTKMMDEMKTWTKTTIADKSNLGGNAVPLCDHQPGCPVKKSSNFIAFYGAALVS